MKVLFTRKYVRIFTIIQLQIYNNKIMNAEISLKFSIKYVTVKWLGIKHQWSVKWCGRIRALGKLKFYTVN